MEYERKRLKYGVAKRIKSSTNRDILNAMIYMLEEIRDQEKKLDADLDSLEIVIRRPHEYGGPFDLDKDGELVTTVGITFYAEERNE